MQTNNANSSSSTPGVSQSAGAAAQIPAPEALSQPTSGPSSSGGQAGQDGRDDKKEPQQLSAAVAASAYGAYALHVAITEMDALAAKVMAFATRLSELRTIAGVPDLEPLRAGGLAYHGLLHVFEDLTCAELGKDYERTEDQLRHEIHQLTPILPDTQDSFQVVSDMYATCYGAKMLHEASEKVELARHVASADHDEVVGYADELRNSGFEPIALRAVSGLKSATEQFTAAQAAIRQGALEAHHALLEAVDHGAIACGTLNPELAISIHGVDMAV